MKTIFCMMSIWAILIASCAMPSSRSAINKHTGAYKLGEREFSMQLPLGMQLVSSLNSQEPNYPVYMQWGRKPWNVDALTERRYANILVLSYFTNAEYSRLALNDGSMYSSPYYLDTALKYHTDIKIYRTKAGRAPVLVRYDSKDARGVFCLVASVETYENKSFESDILDMIASLKTFEAEPTGSSREKLIPPPGAPAQR